MKNYKKIRQIEISKLQELKSIADETLQNINIHTHFKNRYMYIVFFFKQVIHEKYNFPVADTRRLGESFINNFNNIQTTYTELFNQTPEKRP